MIKKLPRIDSFGSFQRFTWNAELPAFASVNILYGRNYSGKTTLSRILRCFETKCIPQRIDNPLFEMEMSDGNTFTQAQLPAGPCIRVFNQDFVRENLHFISDPGAGLTPFAVLGADNAALQLQIDEIERRLGSRDEAAEEGLRAEYRRKQSAAASAAAKWNELTNELERLLTDKATNQETGIKYASGRFGDQNYNKQKLRRELEVVLDKDFQSMDEQEVKRLDALLAQQPLANLAEFAANAPQLTKHIDAASQLVSTPVTNADKIQELIANISLNQWVHSGLNFHHGPGESCKFCGEKISAGRWAELDRHFDEESQKLQAALNNAIAEIHRDLSNLVNIKAPSQNAVYPNLQPELQAAETALIEWQHGMQVALDLIIAQLEQRRQQLHVPFDFSQPETTFKSFTKIAQQLNDVIVKSNAYTDQLETDQSAAKEKLRLNEVLTFSKEIGYADRLQKISEALSEKDRLDAEKVALGKQIAELEQQIVVLRGQMSDQTAGAAATNSYLQHSFGHRELSLRLVEEPDGVDRATRFEICRNGVPACHLSEGECSLIAFCYFVARLQDVQTHGQKPIIWIDDPICSLDGNHIFFIFSLLDAEIAQARNFSQLFVSTHNLEFLRYLHHLQIRCEMPDGTVKVIKSEKFNWLLVSRHGESSALTRLPDSIKKYFTEFSYLFEQILKVSEINVAHEDGYRQLYGFGNDLRKFLEVFLYYRFPDRKFSSEAIGLFLGDEIKASLVNRVVNEFSHLIGRVERGGAPVDVPELVSAAQCVLEALQRDEEQYASLLRSTGRGPMQI